MSLTERLKAAQAVRQAEAAGNSKSPPPETGASAVLDLRSNAEPALDLTDAQPDWALAEPIGASEGNGAGISYDPVRNGDASLAFGDAEPLIADRESRQLCPRCGGTTQIDLYDQVHQVVSLSCTTCFHMFRVPA